METSRQKLIRILPAIISLQIFRLLCAHNNRRNVCQFYDGVGKFTASIKINLIDYQNIHYYIYVLKEIIIGFYFAKKYMYYIIYAIPTQIVI